MKYPEHEKLDKVEDKSQVIGEFLEWLNVEKSITLCQEDTDSYENAFLPTYQNNESLLAEFFEIDLTKLEKEKRQMLKELRKQK